MIPVFDLLGRPWAELDCGRVVQEGLRRLGAPEAAAQVPTAQESAQAFLAQPWGSWRLVGAESCQARPGDLVACEGPLGWHLNLVLQQGRVLTSTIQNGVCLLPLRRVACSAVYRWEPST